MPPARFAIRDVLLVVVVLAVAAVARFGYLLSCADEPWQPPPLQVQDADTAVTLDLATNAPLTDRDLLVANVAETRWFGTRTPLAKLDEDEETAHVAPGYYFLVGWLAYLQNDADTTTWTIRITQSVLGVLTAGLYFLVARLLFGSSCVAFLAGLATAVHPYWIINNAELQDGTLASFLLASCLFLGTAASRKCRPATSLLFGLALAGLALVRAALLPFAFVACLWFLLRCRHVPRGGLCALLAFLGFANGLTPWLVRNFLVFDDVVPITDSLYFHLWMGNNRHATGGPQDPRTQEAALPAQRLKELRSDTNQAHRYGTLSADFVDSVESDPAATVQNRLRSLLCFVFGEDWFGGHGQLSRRNTAVVLPEPVAVYWPLAMGVALLVMLTLGLCGWRWSFGYQAKANLASLAVLWIPLPYLLGHAERFAGPRLPLDGVLLCFTAFALVWGFPPLARVVFPSKGGDNE